MHELPVTESILRIVLTNAEKNGVRRVIAVNLQVGRLSDLEDDWIQRYFDYLSRGTIAEGAKLRIERMPILVQCSACAASYGVEKAAIGDSACPACGHKGGRLISGREYFIKDMEAR
jgi:hydrogenase nickel incorporation protein HypA/HybF